jgi:hypothetical protein
MRRLTLRPQLLFGVALAAMTAACGILPTATPAPTPTIVPALPTVVPTATPVPAAAPTNTPVAAAIPTPLAQPSPTASSVIAVAKPTAEQRLPGPASETAILASRFEAAINAGDVEGVLALFDPNAEVKVPPDRYVGLTQIRNWITYLAANHFGIEPGFRNVVGERASWPAEVRSDYLDRIGLPSLLGTASLTLHNGLIQNYTFVLTEDSAHRHRAAQLAASDVLQDPVIVGQDAANVYGFTDVFRDEAGQLVSYRDVLTADPGSGPFYDLGGEPIIIRSGI